MNPVELAAPNPFDPDVDLDLFDDKRCADCQCPVAMVEESREDRFGNDIERYHWHITFEVEGGALVCEDCAMEREESGP